MKNLRDILFVEIFQSKLENSDFEHIYKVLNILFEVLNTLF